MRKLEASSAQLETKERALDSPEDAAASGEAQEAQNWSEPSLTIAAQLVSGA